MRSITRSALGTGAAALLAASTAAEVHRFTEETLTLLMPESLDVPEVYAEPAKTGSDGPPRAFSAERLIVRHRDTRRSAIADDGEGLPHTVRTVFAVDRSCALGGEMPLDLGLLKLQGRCTR